MSIETLIAEATAKRLLGQPFFLQAWIFAQFHDGVDSFGVAVSFSKDSIMKIATARIREHLRTEELDPNLLAAAIQQLDAKKSWVSPVGRVFSVVSRPFSD